MVQSVIATMESLRIITPPPYPAQMLSEMVQSAMATVAEDMMYRPPP
eukprot:CAMPEP_0171752032 /NCGR_PEP_ID=MMETSP0991-20121206/42368_1 /TAXON_ID=483369 /ORGANISM="non described non described, Strain CCMP2098" /LENGTH=46 /DNA_ID= /DNA_START= /DNA_END= /DNA_ORIENTATION=